MNVTFKDTSNIQSKAQINHMVQVPLSQPSEPTLKTNSQNIMFKGLSDLLYKQVNKTPYNKEEILGIAKKYLGPSTEELFESVKGSNLAKKMFSVDANNGVTFHKKTILHLVYDGIVYPIKILPADILNGIVGVLRRVKPLQKWAEGVYHSKMFRNIRQRSKIDSKVNALNGMFETITKIKQNNEIEVAKALKENNPEKEKLLKEQLDKEFSDALFQHSIKMFDSKTGNYDTKHERSLNRIVSGAIPAFFLSNDAYNLSIMCNDNKKEAKREKQIRFKQEVSRVGVTAYLTLITMGAIQKHINNSKLGIMLMTGSTVLFTEMFSRLINGKHIVRLSPEKAKEINAKEKNKDEIKDKALNDDYKSVFFKSTENKNSFALFNNGKSPEFKGFSQKTTQKHEPLMSFGTIMKASVAIIGTGFAIKGLRTYKSIDNLFKSVEKPLNDLYKNLTVNPNYKISEDDFNKIVIKLEKNGFKELAKKYKEIAKNITIEMPLTLEEIAKGKVPERYLDLGKKDKKIKPAIDFILAPFDFIFSAIKLPYSLVNKGVKMFAKKKPPEAKDMTKLNIEALSKSIENIGKEALKEKYDAERFKSFVNDNVLKAFNTENMSNVSNNELANLAKTSATAATIWFLMADNYNMVMLKSNGEDKTSAQLKSKERFVQEGSRLFYQTLLISLFNSTFRTQYNGSLWGMTWVTSICTYLSENLNRKSIGMPVKTHSRDELLAIEKKKENTTGFLKGYYNFMAKLTGKKSLSEMQKNKSNK